MNDPTGLGIVAKSIVDKIAGAIGILYSDSDYKIKQESKRDFLKRIGESKDLHEYEKVAIISNFRSTFKEYKNQNDIIKIALGQLKECVEVDKVDKVDDDWLLYFFDQAKNISNKDIQVVWGNILANEFSTPDSVPKSLINTLSIISYDDADTFNQVCRFCVKTEGEYDLLYLNDSINEEKFIDFDKLMELDKLNLIMYRPDTGFIRKRSDSNPDTFVFDLFDYRYTVKSSRKEGSKYIFELGDILFTKSGLSLCRAIKPNPMGMLNEIVEKFYTKEQGYEITKVEIDS